MKEVDAALIDAFAATGYERMLQTKSLRLGKLIKANAGFGVILSGNSINLQSNIEGLIKANQKIITDFISTMKGRIPVS